MLVYVPDPDIVTEEPPEDPPTTILTNATSARITIEHCFSSRSEQPRSTVTASAPPKPAKKRTGSNRQPQSRAKRKPTLTTRIYTNEPYNEHDAPLLGMLPSLRSLRPVEVHTKINEVVNSLVPVLKLSSEKLEHLLHHFQWNTDKLMQEFFTDSTGILKGAGLSGEPSCSPPSRRRTITCPVCTLSVSSRDLHWLWCNHPCCQVSIFARN